MLLLGESAKMSYDSGISSGPPGGMFSSSKFCCALFKVLYFVALTCRKLVFHDIY